MSEFLAALETFVYGFAVGFFAQSVWAISKKIWYEAKKSKEEW